MLSLLFKRSLLTTFFLHASELCENRKLHVEKKTLYIPGTQDVWELIQEAKFGKSKFANGYIHKGFSKIYFKNLNTYMDIINNNDIEQIVGYSLGGVMGILLAYELSFQGRPLNKVVTFGCPKIGDIKHRKDFKVYRIFNKKDIVTQLPPLCSHIGDGIHADFNLGSVLENHRIENYKNKLETMLN